MAKSNKRPIAVLHIAMLKVLAIFIAKMRTISLNMANHVALFPTPAPSLATFNTNIDALEAAEAVASTHVTGSAALRDQAYDLVLDNVHSLQAYVQVLADAAADVDDAIALILNSGFDLKSQGTFVKPEFEVVNSEISGAVELVAKSSGSHSANEWRRSTDGINWTMLPSTIKAKTTESGLTPGATVYFQHRPVLSDGVGNWSQVVSIIVT